MADEKDNKLLNEIKNYLEITWDDSLGMRRSGAWSKEEWLP